MNQKEKIKLANYVIDLDAKPFVPSGWQLIHHEKSGKWIFDHDELEIFHAVAPKYRHERFYDDEDKWLNMGRMPFNANLADFFLDHQELIPGPWELYGEVVFDGTIYLKNMWHCGPDLSHKEERFGPCTCLSGMRFIDGIWKRALLSTRSYFPETLHCVWRSPIK